MPKISIIVPVYNTENYLRKCLDSLVNQTLQDIEIICVDDCSPDNSRNILREYENRYPEQLKCIYLKENVRQGGARNCGMRAAAGDYILFVDSDDYVEKDLCEKLYRSAAANGADAVVYDYIVEDGEKSLLSHVLNPQLREREDIAKAELANGTASCYAWNKLWKKELIVQEECFFPQKMVYEDIAVTYVWLFKAQKINYISEGLYHYVFRKNSTVNISSIENWGQFVEAVMALIHNFITFGLHEQYRGELTTLVLLLLNGFMATVLNGTEIETQDVYRKLVDSINQNLPDWEDVLEQDERITPAQKYTLTCFLRSSNFRYALLEKAAAKYQDKNVAIWGAGKWGRHLGENIRKRF